MNLSAYERETLINYCAADSTADVFTYDKKLIRRLDAFCAEFPDRFRKKSINSFGGVTYVIPKKYVAIRKPASDKTKEAARERAISGQYQPPKRKKHSDS